MTDSGIQRELGSIDAKLDAIKETVERIEKRQDDHEERLREVEMKSVRNGLVAGGVISVGIAFLRHKLGW